MPMQMQAKLLRVLEEEEVVPIGESFPCKVNVRVLSATNRDLRAEVKRGNFREDLFYRLAVFPIRVPPLRERRGYSRAGPTLSQRGARTAAQAHSRF
jgi:two-component system, NtrC family, response regulator